MCRSRVPSTPLASTTETAMSPHATIDLEDLGRDRGAHMLIDRALRALPVGGTLAIHGRAPALHVHLRAWARDHGHMFSAEDGVITRGGADTDRLHNAERAGGPLPAEIWPRPGATWGLAARGALVEAGGPLLHL